MLNKIRLVQIERAWRAVVFGRNARRVVLSWLGLTIAAMLARAVPALTLVSAATLHYIVPVGFVAIVWLVASSFALTAALSFSRREIGVGLWMSAWTVVLGVLGATAVVFMVYG